MPPEDTTPAPQDTDAVAISRDEHDKLVEDAHVGRQFKERAEELSRGDRHVYEAWVSMTRGDVASMDDLGAAPEPQVEEPAPDPEAAAQPVTRADLRADRESLLADVQKIVATAVTESVAPLERERDVDRRVAEKTEAVKLFGQGDDAKERFTTHWDKHIKPLLKQRPDLSALSIDELVKMTGYDEHVASARTSSLDARKAAFRSRLDQFAPPPRRASSVNRSATDDAGPKKTMREAALDIVMEHYAEVNDEQPR